MYDTITEKDAGALLAELLAVRLSDINNSPLKIAILKELSKSNILTQKDLTMRIKKSQTAVSRAAKALVDLELIRYKKEGRNIQYWATAEIKLAANHL